MSSEEWTYEELKRRIEEDCKKQEAYFRAIRRKRDERRNIRKGGGGKAIAKAILGGKRVMDNETDFNFGANVPRGDSESVDDRIAREQAERCMEKVYCTACKTYHGYCAEIKEDKERMKMLPTGDGTGTQARRQGGLDFINPQDLTTTPQEAKILMVKFTEKGGKSGQPSITLKVAFKGGIKYVWVPCRQTDPRYKVLLSAFGPDENNWVDERFGIYLEKNEFTENYEQKIVVPKGGETKEDKKGAKSRV